MICPAIAVNNRTVVLHAVLVGPVASVDDRCRCDRQRQLDEGGLEDALRPDEGHSRPIEYEAPAQEFAREDVAMETSLLLEELERGGADTAVQIGVATRER